MKEDTKATIIACALGVALAIVGFSIFITLYMGWV